MFIVLLILVAILSALFIAFGEEYLDTLLERFNNKKTIEKIVKAQPQGHPCVMCSKHKFYLRNNIEGDKKCCTSFCKYKLAYDSLGMKFNTDKDITDLALISRDKIYGIIHQLDEQKEYLQQFTPTYEHIETVFANFRLEIKYVYNIDILEVYKKYTEEEPAYHNLNHAKAVLFFTIVMFTDDSNSFTQTDEYKVAYHNRKLLYLAAFFHDIGHKNVADSININTACDIVSSVFTGTLSKLAIDTIKRYIRYTEFPYVDSNKDIYSKYESFIQCILRAADLSQIFIKDLNVHKLCYNLHKKELNKDVSEDTNEFMKTQIDFYNSMAEKNKVFAKYYNELFNTVFGRYL